MPLHALVPSLNHRSLARVLVVESDDDVREMLGLSLTGMGLAVDCVSGCKAARALLTQRAYRLCLTDLKLNDGDGLALVRHAREHCPGLPVVVLTAGTRMESAVAALKAGAIDCLAKPLCLDELRALVRNTLDIVLPTAPLEAPLSSEVLVGKSESMSALREQIAALARLPVTVSVVGESGSGKTLVARLIHAASARADRHFVVVDCHAAPDALELFGAEKAASHEAAGPMPGLLHAADGGVLFLHHVDALSRPLQLRLARVLEATRVRRTGAAYDEPIDLRVVASSATPLARLHEAGRVVDALYYALDRAEVHVPALRDRRQDIPLLAGHILARLGERFGMPEVVCSEDALSRLMRNAFPGNVRELEAVLERSLAASRVALLQASDLRLDEVVDAGE